MGVHFVPSLEDVAKGGVRDGSQGSPGYLCSHVGVRSPSSEFFMTPAMNKSEIFGCKEQKCNSSELRQMRHLFQNWAGY